MPGLSLKRRAWAELHDEKRCQLNKMQEEDGFQHWHKQKVEKINRAIENFDLCHCEVCRDVRKGPYGSDSSMSDSDETFSSFEYERVAELDRWLDEYHEAKRAKTEEEQRERTERRRMQACDCDVETPEIWQRRREEQAKHEEYLMTLIE